MDTSQNYTRMILLYVLLDLGRFIDSCQMKNTNNPISGYKCVPDNNGDEYIGAYHFPQCVWKCLGKPTCHYVNHDIGTGQCVLGLSVCVILEPAPGFLVEAFGPYSHSCLRWGPHDEPNRTPIQMHDGLQMIYLSRLLRSNILIPGKYIADVQNFWCSIEGEKTGPIGLEGVSFLTTNPACTIPWMPYTAGASIPHGAVIGGHLADGTHLYVAWVDDGTHRPAYGYYNPSSEVAHYEIDGGWTTTTMRLLILL